MSQTQVGLRAGRAPASSRYECDASLPTLAELKVAESRGPAPQRPKPSFALAMRLAPRAIDSPKMAENGGAAPQPANRSIRFRGGARACAGSFSNVAESSGSAPQTRRFEPASNRPRYSIALLSKMAEARGADPQRPKPSIPLQTGLDRRIEFASRMAPCQGL